MYKPTIENTIALFKDSGINLQELRKFLEDVPVYLVGSRYLGIENANSDYDFLLQFTPFRFHKLASILGINIDVPPDYLGFDLDHEFDLSISVKEQEASAEGNLILTALTFFEANEGLNKRKTKAHFIFTYYLKELLHVYSYCKTNKLFTAETDKQARIEVFNFLTSKELKKILRTPLPYDRILIDEIEF